jgi:enoyl-CoA hydratase
MVLSINRLFAGWYSFPRPVVAAVNGHAIAGGLILALCADHRVGGGGKLGLTELRAGIGYPVAAMTVVRAELTPAAARQLVLRSKLVSPQEALAVGALDELVSEGEVLARALEVAGELAALPREAYGRIKHQLRGEAIAALAAIDQDPLLDSWIPSEAGDAASAILRGP